METFHRLVVPALVVILLTATVIFSLLSRPENRNFDGLLEELGTSQNPQSVLDSINRHLHFQELGLNPEPGTTDAQALADLYFQAGNALHKRKEEVFLETVFELYAKSVRLFPSLRHGWPFFNMAEIRNAQGRLPEAQELYQKTILYDYGNLSLMAGYWMELLNHRQGKTVDPLPVYTYYRYGDLGWHLTMQPFAQAQFEAQPEALLIQALAKSQSVNPLLPDLDLLQEYCRQRPNDYSARYYLASITHTLLPENGKLQEAAYALHAQQNGHLRLLPDGQLRVDFYIPATIDEPYTIQFEWENPFGLNGQMQVFLNAKPVTVLSNQNPRQTQTVQVNPRPGRNLLTLHYLPLSGSTSEEFSWIEIDDLHIVLPETAP